MLHVEWQKMKNRFLEMRLYLPLQAGGAERLRQEGLQFGPEAGVEPSVHDRVREGGGKGDGVAQTQHEVEGLLVLKMKSHLYLCTFCP